jgi:hypothetical protein
MAFLSKAIGDVLAEVQIDREKIQRQSEHNANLRAKEQADQEQAEKDH